MSQEEKIAEALLLVQRDIRIFRSALLQPPRGATPELMEVVRQKLELGVIAEANALAALSRFETAKVKEV